MIPEYPETKGGTQGKSSTVATEHRKHYRHPIHWRIALIHKIGDKNDTYHGKSHDMSMMGASILIDHNIFVMSEVVVLLSIPPLHAGQKETIIEIQCGMVYTVLDSEQNLFRIGLLFRHFKGEGRHFLSDILSKRALPKDTQNSYVVE